MPKSKSILGNMSQNEKKITHPLQRSASSPSKGGDPSKANGDNSVAPSRLAKYFAITLLAFSLVTFLVNAMHESPRGEPSVQRELRISKAEFTQQSIIMDDDAGEDDEDQDEMGSAGGGEDDDDKDETNEESEGDFYGEGGDDDINREEDGDIGRLQKFDEGEGEEDEDEDEENEAGPQFTGEEEDEEEGRMPFIEDEDEEDNDGSDNDNEDTETDEEDEQQIIDSFTDADNDEEDEIEEADDGEDEQEIDEDLDEEGSDSNDEEYDENVEIGESCIITIDHKQYDVAPWAKDHPGGVRVLKNNCGLDATHEFHDLPHSKKAIRLLKNYLVRNKSKQKKDDNLADAIDLQTPMAQLVGKSASKEAKKDTPALKGSKVKETMAEHEPVAGLNCDAHGGPSEDIAKEMVYWEDIKSDNKYVSPFKRKDEVQYLTFEPDGGGWNNIRMAMETVLALAVATGRTLVLPPEQSMYLLGRKKNPSRNLKGSKAKKQNTYFSFAHFFPMESIAHENMGLDIISMEEFLEREGKTGKLKDQETGKVLYPPENRTDWDGEDKEDLKEDLDPYLRSVGLSTVWDPNECMAVFPKKTGSEGIKKVKSIKKKIENSKNGFKPPKAYVGKPVPVNASLSERMKENWAFREDLCLYTTKMQKAKVLHFPHDAPGVGESARLLTHFYAFLFFEDWKQELWMKRFVRDHVRYIDEIQCAAARVVHAIRERAKKNKVKSDANGDFDALHIRRGDFAYEDTRVDAEDIVEASEDELVEGSTVYIATDERDRSFFKPLADKYDIVFLDDFTDAIKDLNSNYFGMLDQLISSRSRTFFGCWYSTFTGYINRIRGYHADNQQLPGYEDGVMESYYYALEDMKMQMRTYYPVNQPFYSREFPTSWRNIDQGIRELAFEQEQGDDNKLNTVKTKKEKSGTEKKSVEKKKSGTKKNPAEKKKSSTTKKNSTEKKKSGNKEKKASVKKETADGQTSDEKNKKSNNKQVTTEKKGGDNKEAVVEKKQNIVQQTEMKKEIS